MFPNSIWRSPKAERWRRMWRSKEGSVNERRLSMHANTCGTMRYALVCAGGHANGVRERR